ncbi:MAG: hypothetical protein GXO80_03125 [Chlorobi bacterium]|nr:hypothetical protein [Chlorobiota bacterium]
MTNDKHYSVIKVEMGIANEINLNFVSDLHISQEFDFINNKCWILKKDELIIDFNIGKKGAGMFGKRSVYYDNYVFNKKRGDTIYSGIEKTIRENNYDKKDNNYWEENRLTKLTDQEQNVKSKMYIKWLTAYKIFRLSKEQ